MNIDIQPLVDFEREYSVVIDTLEQLKRLEPPVELEGAQGIAKWFREFHQTLLTFTMAPDGTRLIRFAEEVEAALAKVGGQAAPAPPSPKHEMLPTPRGFWAEIVTVVGSGEYTFKEKRLTDGTTWADLTGGRTGTVFEGNDVNGIAVGTIIRVAVEHDTGGDLRYVCEWAIPAGPDTDYKVLQRKSDDTIGWDWVRAH